MQYMLLIYEPESEYANRSEDQLMHVVQKHMALAEELRTKGQLIAGDGLETVDTATTVINSGGQQTVHDGPFAETREQLGGYYVIEVPDLDEALAIARRMPVCEGGKVEVRPVMTY